MSRRFTPTPAYRIFLDLLVRERQSRNVTQDELAGRLEFSPAQVAAFESGKHQIDLVQTMEWCTALGTSFVDFMVKLDEEITAQLPAANAPAPDAKQEGGAK